MPMTCGLYERTAISTGITLRMVLPDPQPASWHRVQDAECDTQWSPKDNAVVRADSMPEPKASAIDYFRAERSLAVEGPVSVEAYEARKAQCMACPKRQASARDDIGFCGSCGCGQRDRARLTVKLTMPAASCPLGKWGEAKGSASAPRQAIQAAVWTARGVVSGVVADLARRLAPD